MSSRFRDAIGPAYLFLCLILGGSAQGAWGNMTLQLLGLALLVWAASAPQAEKAARALSRLLIMAIVAIAYVALQAVPVPPSVWTGLGGRAAIADGYRILGIETPWLPISVTPYLSLATLLTLIPPLALFCTIVILRAYRPSWLAAGLILGTIAGVLLGALQVSGGGGDVPSRWYLYRESSFGFATGFFANANHMAGLLVSTIPFLAALLTSARSANRQRNSAIIAGVTGAGLLILVGIALNHSLAAYLLTLPVLGISALIAIPRRSRWRKWAIGAAAAILAAGLGAVWTDSFRNGPFGSDTATSVGSRQEMLATTAKAVGDFMPWGSGLGSFQDVYHLYEKPAEVTNTYVVHAHNDYAELTLELGLVGVLVILAFLAWWAGQAWSAWRFADASAYSRAAAVTSGAMLIHSLVDFPLRTGALAAVLAMCLALLVERRTSVVRTKSDLWPTRHVVLR